MAILESGRIFPPGLGIRDLIHVEARDARAALWAMEEGLRCPALSLVVGELWGDPAALDFTATRRLAVAAERQRGGRLFDSAGRPPQSLAARGCAGGCRACPSAPNPLDPKAPGAPRWDAELFRARGRPPGRWSIGDEPADQPNPQPRLPHFVDGPVDPLPAANDAPPEANRQGPLALVIEAAHGPVIHAVNAAAMAGGARRGMRLTDARALNPALQIAPADLAAEDAQLADMARWARRWSPLVEVDGDDGLRLDVSGAAHLFGGERGLIADVRACFERAGFADPHARSPQPPPRPGRWRASARTGRSAGPTLPPRCAAAGRRAAPVTTRHPHARAARAQDHRDAGRDRAAKPRAALPRGRQSARRARPRARPQARAADRRAPRAAAARDCCASPSRSTIPKPAAQALDLLVPRLVAELEARKLGARQLSLTGYRVDGEHRRGRGRDRDPQPRARSTSSACSPTRRRARPRLRLRRLRPYRRLGRAAGRGAGQPGRGTVGRGRHRAAGRPAVGQAGRVAGAPAERAREPFPGAGEWVGGGCSSSPAFAGEVARDARRRGPSTAFGGPPPHEIGGGISAPSACSTGPRRSRSFTRPPRACPAASSGAARCMTSPGSPGPERIAPEWWRQPSSARLRDYYQVEDQAGRRYWIYREGVIGDGRGGRPRLVHPRLFGRARRCLNIPASRARNCCFATARRRRRSRARTMSSLGSPRPFSFLRGASDAIELVLHALELGMDSLGVADRNTLAGVVRMHSACKGAGLRPLIGCRLDLSTIPA